MPNRHDDRRDDRRASLDPIAAGFREVPMEARLRLFWRIFGPAWAREEIDVQLAELRRVGVGGVMTCFTYPVALDDPAAGLSPFVRRKITISGSLRSSVAPSHDVIDDAAPATDTFHSFEW